MRPLVVKGSSSDEIVVVKIGGSTLGSHDTTLEDLVALQKDGFRVVVVHGGGRAISEWMEHQGIKPRFIRGLRVTDYQSVQIATAVLTGLVNKQLVASLMTLGGRAIGFSGVDGGMLECKSADPDLGYVGAVIRVRTDPLDQALNSGYMPLVAPVGFHSNDGSDKSGCLLNINGDTVAGEIAHCLGASRLIFLTDVDGIQDASGRKVPRLNARQARMLIRSGVAKGGMIPKLEACLKAIPKVQIADILDGREHGALRKAVLGESIGTRVQSNT